MKWVTGLFSGLANQGCCRGRRAHQYLLPVYLQTAGFSRVVPRRSMYSTGQPSPGSSAAHNDSGQGFEFQDYKKS